MMSRLGFDIVRLRFTMRTAVAACLAVWIAWLAGLEHPQWSGMTVWAASLPVRGQLLEKGAFRAVGTIAGAIFGIVLLFVAGGQRWILVAGLAVWISLSAGAGNIARGFASYGAMLAGYTAAMVALLHSAHSSDLLAVGIDRMLTVLLGVAVALAAGWMSVPSGESDDPAVQTQRLTRRILDDLVGRLSGRARPDTDEYRDLLSEMAAIEEGLDHHAAGSLRSREQSKAVRRQLLALVAVLLWIRRDAKSATHALLIGPLGDAGKALQARDGRPQAADALRRAAGLSRDPALSEALADLAAAFVTPSAAKREPHHRHSAPLVLHRDWVGAREAALRAGFVMLAIGSAWLLSGWDGATFMMLGAGIMTTVFSTFDAPAVMLRQVIVGQTLGVVGALICRWLVWPLAGSEAGIVAAMMPFVLLGGLLFGHRKGSGPVGFDYNMVVLLLLQPVWPLAGSLSQSLAVGAAVILGPAIAMIAYLLIFPVDADRRVRTLMAMMVHDTEAMARSRGASNRGEVWRMRSYHRILRLTRWADKTGVGREAVDTGFALMLAGACVLHIDELDSRTGSDRKTTRQLDAVRARLGMLSGNPEKAVRILATTAERLADDPDVDTGLLRETAAELSACSAFLARLGNRS